MFRAKRWVALGRGAVSDFTGRRDVQLTYVVNESCIRCKYMDCVEVCPVDCFYEGENMLVIHPDECIDCGVCEPECPVDAIKADTEPGLEKWLLLNAEYARIGRTSRQRESLRPTPRTGRGNRTNSNTSREIPARVLMRTAPAGWASDRRSASRSNRAQQRPYDGSVQWPGAGRPTQYRSGSSPALAHPTVDSRSKQRD